MNTVDTMYTTNSTSEGHRIDTFTGEQEGQKKSTQITAPKQQHHCLCQQAAKMHTCRVPRPKGGRCIDTKHNDEADEETNTGDGLGHICHQRCAHAASEGVNDRDGGG